MVCFSVPCHKSDIPLDSCSQMQLLMPFIQVLLKFIETLNEILVIIVHIFCKWQVDVLKTETYPYASATMQSRQTKQNKTIEHLLLTMAGKQARLFCCFVIKTETFVVWICPGTQSATACSLCSLSLFNESIRSGVWTMDWMLNLWK